MRAIPMPDVTRCVAPPALSEPGVRGRVNLAFSRTALNMVRKLCSVLGHTLTPGGKPSRSHLSHRTVQPSCAWLNCARPMNRFVLGSAIATTKDGSPDVTGGTEISPTFILQISPGLKRPKNPKRSKIAKGKSSLAHA